MAGKRDCVVLIGDRNQVLTYNGTLTYDEYEEAKSLMNRPGHLNVVLVSGDDKVLVNSTTQVYNDKGEEICNPLYTIGCVQALVIRRWWTMEDREEWVSHLNAAWADIRPLIVRSVGNGDLLDEAYVEEDYVFISEQIGKTLEELDKHFGDQAFQVLGWDDLDKLWEYREIIFKEPRLRIYKGRGNKAEGLADWQAAHESTFNSVGGIKPPPLGEHRKGFRSSKERPEGI